jgi:hypothetical protein
MNADIIKFDENRSKILSFIPNYFKYSNIKITLLLMLLYITFSSCGIGVGVGPHSLNDKNLTELDNKVVLNFDAQFYNFSKTFNIRPAITTSMTELDSHLILSDLRIPIRMYLVKSKYIMPYLGTGLGYSNLNGNQVQIQQLQFEPGDHNWEIKTIGPKRQYYGFFPFAEAGITIPLSQDYYIKLSYEEDFNKKISDLDLSGNRYMVTLIYSPSTFFTW